MCTAVNRILVHAKIFDQFAEKLKSRLAAVVIGDGLDSRVQMGPVIDKENQSRLLELVEVARKETDLLLEGCVPDYLPREGSLFHLLFLYLIIQVINLFKRNCLVQWFHWKCSIRKKKR